LGVGNGKRRRAMANQQLLGVFAEAQQVADAMTSLKDSGYPVEDLDIYSGSPYPEGSFGEQEPQHRVYVWPFIGAICGFTAALLFTAGTQVSYPLVTGGKPILSIPPMTIFLYEGTMLGAIVFTVLGVLFESRLPRRRLGLYDTRITEGYVGILVSCPPEQATRAERIMRDAGAEDVKTESR
jgi:hypothetical protein